jgi:rod shape-determining protein MreB
MVLAGGGALLRGVDHYLSARVGVPVRVADDPRTCVARGAGQALDRFEVLRRGQLHLR